MYCVFTAAGTVYVSKWFAFNEFDFMADKNTPNDTVDTLPDVSIFHYNICNPSMTKGGKNCPSF